MNEKFNKNAKVEQLTKLFLSREEEKGLIVKDPSVRAYYCGHTVHLHKNNHLIKECILLPKLMICALLTPSTGYIDIGVIL